MKQQKQLKHISRIIWERDPIGEEQVKQMPSEVKTAILELNFIGEFNDHKASGGDANRVGELISLISNWDYRACNYFFRKRFKF